MQGGMCECGVGVQEWGGGGVNVACVRVCVCSRRSRVIPATAKSYYGMR